MSRKKFFRHREADVPFCTRLLDMLDIPAEGVTAERCVTVAGDHTVSVSGCLGVLEYAPERIVLHTEDGDLTLHGARLTIVSLVEDHITVHGSVARLTFGKTEEEQ